MNCHKTLGELNKSPVSILDDLEKNYFGIFKNNFQKSEKNRNYMFFFFLRSNFHSKLANVFSLIFLFIREFFRKSRKIFTSKGNLYLSR